MRTTPKLPKPCLADVMDEHATYFNKERFKLFKQNAGWFHKTYSECLETWLEHNKHSNDLRFQHCLPLLNQLRAQMEQGLVTESAQVESDFVRNERLFQNRHHVTEEDERAAWFANREGDGMDPQVRALKTDYGAAERLRISIQKQLNCADMATNRAHGSLTEKINFKNLPHVRQLSDWSVGMVANAQQALRELKERDDCLDASRALTACVGKPFRLEDF